ncbi:MAG TPA: CBS domain-containing protein [Pyrinomonadaceae bacterium]|nr:CBS domain-containing protein [Pyrinomonadaceae bacterium]
MKAKEIMTPNAIACTPTSMLADAAKAMWDNDCGILPVVTEGGKVVGLITDRDICMAAGMHNCNLSNLAVEDVINGKVYSVKPEEDVHKALEVMRDHKIRRVPVVDADDKLQGMLSMNDVVLRAQDAKDKKVSSITYADVVDTYKSICAHQLPIERTHGAGA